VYDGVAPSPAMGAHILVVGLPVEGCMTVNVTTGRAWAEGAQLLIHLVNWPVDWSN